MTPLDQHDINVAHDLGTLEGKVAAIYENTKNLPELIAKVEKHEQQLRFINWIASTAGFVFLMQLGAWVKAHFAPGVK